MPACTAIKGQGATVLSPLIASPERVRVSVAFSSRRPSRPLSFQPAFSRCKTAAVPIDLSSRSYVSSGTACPTVLPACRSFVATPKLASNVLRRVLGTPSHMPSGRYRASLLLIEVGMPRGGGGFAPPSSRPSLDQLCSHSCATKGYCDPVTLMMYLRGTWLDATHSNG